MSSVCVANLTAFRFGPHAVSKAIARTTALLHFYFQGLTPLSAHSSIEGEYALVDNGVRGHTGFFSGDITVSGAYPSRGALVGTLRHEFLHSGLGIGGRLYVNAEDLAARAVGQLVGPTHYQIYQLGYQATDRYRAIGVP